MSHLIWFNRRVKTKKKKTNKQNTIYLWLWQNDLLLKIVRSLSPSSGIEWNRFLTEVKGFKNTAMTPNLN